ncbi:acyltransferase family protein [Salinispora arenicola]|uniref:acyltransferase family protein n=1 Tax=Salinispora arenicola TaxID=168697 RepID=UPI00207A595E|nr:acyltransferase family protein [Salinispora arenicola]MCN0177169.1 acyltransferase family protein [Salinispora arenicola]
MTSIIDKPPAPRTQHLYYLDNLRVVMVLLVVIHHAAQAYGPADWWYVTGDQHAPVLATLSAVGGAFRMSLLFFVAAFLVPRAADHKGSWGFVRGRLTRLGIPFLVGSATIIPVLMYVYYREYRSYPPISFPRYYLDVFLGFGARPGDWTGPIWPDLQFGHLWFIQHLLAFSALYVLFHWLGGLLRRVRPTMTLARPATILAQRATMPARPATMPARLTRMTGNRSLVIVTLTLAAVVFLVRIWYPLDQWVPLFGFIQAEPARLPQYTAFFTAGVIAYRRDWLARLPRSTGYTWLAIGAALTAVLFWTGSDTRFFAPGGASWASACWALTETFLCVGLSLGLLALFRDAFAGHNRLTRIVAASSYPIYIIHLPIVVALQFAFAHAGLPTLATFVAVATFGMAISVVTAVTLRRLPGLRTIL